MCRKGRPASFSMRSLAVWTVLQASRKKSAPAALRCPAWAASRSPTRSQRPSRWYRSTCSKSVCASTSLALCRGTQARGHQLVDGPVVGDRAGPRQAAHDPDGLHGILRTEAGHWHRRACSGQPTVRHQRADPFRTSRQSAGQRNGVTRDSMIVSHVRSSARNRCQTGSCRTLTSASPGAGSTLPASSAQSARP